MPLMKLESTDAFVVRDLDNETPAIGIVRSAPKILQGGAKELARSQTYQFAALGMQYQGASSGVNAAPEARDEAMAKYCEELLPAVDSGALMIDAAKGVTAEQLGPLTAADSRSDVRMRQVDGPTNDAHLAGIGAVACAGAARSLDGAKIAIENFDETGVAVARAATAAGAKVVAISTSVGTALSEAGMDVDLLASSWAENGPGLIGVFTDEDLPFWRVLGADADVLFAGSKAGLIDHKNGENIKANLIVPTGPIPYTTKAAITLERRGVTVLPDFVTTAGQAMAGFADDGDQAALEAAVTAKLSGLTEAALGTDNMPILEACFAAEAFLKTWRDELPFGRPFA